MSDDTVRLPTHSQRLAVVGRTGSGKTQAGMYWLSLQNFAAFPWLVWDTKRDSFLKKIWAMRGARRVTFSDSITKPGLYYIQPLPHELQSDECENFMWRIHKRGNCGMFLDEAYMMDRYSKALVALYTQGRDLHIPMITLSQKPKYVTPFTWSEADFVQAFHLNDKADQKRIVEFTRADLIRPLRDFHSVWYDVGRNSVVEFSPVPARDRIIENFEAQMRLTKRAI